MSYGLCEEKPYLLGEEEPTFQLPSSIPSTVFEWLENAIAMDTEEAVEEEQPQEQPQEQRQHGNNEELLHIG